MIILILFGLFVDCRKKKDEIPEEERILLKKQEDHKIYKEEKNRLSEIRRKTWAARVIQRAYRK